MIDTKNEKATSISKKPYVSPCITTFGSVAEFTKGTGSKSGEGGTNKKN
jgi:hypothetical protein